MLLLPFVVTLKVSNQGHESDVLISLIGDFLTDDNAITLAMITSLSSAEKSPIDDTRTTLSCPWLETFKVMTKMSLSQ